MIDNNVKVPRWVLAMFMVLIVNIGTFVFASGIIYQKVTELERRVMNMENDIRLILQGR